MTRFMHSVLADLVPAGIRAELARIGMTQQQLAQMVGEQQTWVSRRLTGRTPITLADLDRVADALALPGAQFLNVHDRVAP